MSRIMVALQSPNIVTIPIEDALREPKRVDPMAPMFGGLPEGRCQCPHWGYVTKGRQTWKFGDREEVFEAGDAFYVEPGHVPVFEAGTEMIQFSPTAEMKATDEAIRAYMQANG